MIISNEMIRDKLKDFLHKKGVMQMKVADECGMSRTTLSLFLQNKREVSYRKLLALHQYMQNN